MKCYSKWNDTQDKMSFTMECTSTWNITPNEMSLKWNVPQN